MFFRSFRTLVCPLITNEAQTWLTSYQLQNQDLFGEASKLTPNNIIDVFPNKWYQKCSMIRVEKQETPTICQISWKTCLVIKNCNKQCCLIWQVLNFNILKTSCFISAWSFGLFTDWNYLLNTWKRNTETKFWDNIVCFLSKMFCVANS